MTQQTSSYLAVLLEPNTLSHVLHSHIYRAPVCKKKRGRAFYCAHFLWKSFCLTLLRHPDLKRICWLIPYLLLLSVHPIHSCSHELDHELSRDLSPSPGCWCFIPDVLDLAPRSPGVLACGCPSLRNVNNVLACMFSSFQVFMMEKRSCDFCSTCCCSSWNLQHILLYNMLH